MSQSIPIIEHSDEEEVEEEVIGHQDEEDIEEPKVNITGRSSIKKERL